MSQTRAASRRGVVRLVAGAGEDGMETVESDMKGKGKPADSLA